VGFAEKEKARTRGSTFQLVTEMQKRDSGYLEADGTKKGQHLGQACVWCVCDGAGDGGEQTELGIERKCAPWLA
jgi:hypothetical protein